MLVVPRGLVGDAVGWREVVVGAAGKFFRTLPVLLAGLSRIPARALVYLRAMRHGRWPRFPALEKTF